VSRSKKRDLRTWGLALLILLALVLAIGEAAFGRGGSKHRAPPGDLQTLDAQTYAAWIAGAGDTPRAAAPSGASGHAGAGGGFHDGGFHYGDGGGSSFTDCANPVNDVGTEHRLLEYIDCRTGSGDSVIGGADGSDDLVPTGGNDGGFWGVGGGHSGSGGGSGGGGGGFGGGGPGGNFGTFDPTRTIGHHDSDPPGGPNAPAPNGGFNPVTNLSVSAVPEPGVWVMMIIGFGLTGFAPRRRREMASRAVFT
jgi:hypothetical protein